MDKKIIIGRARVIFFIILIILIVNALFFNNNDDLKYQNIICGYGCSIFTCEPFLDEINESEKKDTLYQVKGGVMQRSIIYEKVVTNAFCFLLIDNKDQKIYEIDLKNNNWMPKFDK